MKTYPHALAFPLSYEEEYGDYGQKKLVTHMGVTKRECFAAMAMQGIIANQTAANHKSSGEAFRNAVARAAVGLADALIKALDQEVQP